MFETVYILGEIEGHDGGGSDKNTKYDEIIPRLVSIENNDDVDGVLFVINTMGGDVSAGLAIAE